MNKKLLIKTLVLCIIVLFICMNVNPSFAFDNIKKSFTPVSDDNILYVGGIGPNNYTKIQDAVDNASVGDTVFVFDDNSPYYENICINKSISLIGEDKNTTVIDGVGIPKYVLNISSDSVIITGFTIFFSENDNFDVGIKVYSKNNSIFENIFVSTGSGIALSNGCEFCKIYHNIFIDNFYGLDIENSNLNTIYSNTFISNNIGIIIDAGTYNRISNNTISSGWIGIELYFYADFNEIFDNNISFTETGIDTVFCSDNYFCGNNITYCSRWGIFLADKNSRIENNFISNNERGIGLILYNNSIKNNIVANNEGDGILISGSNNSITWNIIKNNKGSGLYIEYSNNVVYYNEFMNNSIGLYISECENNLIKYNNFIDNNAFFMYLFKNRRTTKNYFDENYWNFLIGNKKIIFGRLKLVLYTWTNWFTGETYEIALYPLRLNFDWHPAKEPYNIGG